MILYLSLYMVHNPRHDRYGRKIPKHGHGTINLECYTSSSIIIREKVLDWYDQKINKSLTIRRFNLSANHVIDESTIEHQESFMQMDMFTDYDQLLRARCRRRTSRCWP